MAKPLPTQNTFSGVAPPWSLPQLDANFTNVWGAINDVGTYSNTLIDTGSANALVANTPAGVTFSLTAGVAVDVLVANTTNTAAPTLNVNSTGAKAITDSTGNRLVFNAQLIAGGTYRFVYDGTVWKITGAISYSGATNSSTGSITTLEQYIAPTLPMGRSGTLVAGNSFLITIIGRCTCTHSGDTTSIFVRVGTNGTISDTALFQNTYTSVTGASGNAWVVRIYLNMTAVGASGTMQGSIETNNTVNVGLTGINSVSFMGTSTTFNTNQALILGASLVTTAGTTSHIIDEAFNQRLV